MTLTLFFDPGISSGIVLGEYTDDSPWTLIKAWQTTGGVTGLIRWRSENIDIMYGAECGWEFFTENGIFRAGLYGEVEVAAEKWIPYPTAGHSPTLASTYPLVVEGALIDMGLMPDEYPHSAWQRSAEQYFSGGTGQVEKRRKSKQFLMDVGLYLTGKDVGQPDAEDAISATLHQLARMRKLRHAPTMKHYFGEKEEL